MTAVSSFHPVANPMFPRLRTVALIAAAVGGPYAATTTEWGREAVSTVTTTLDTGNIDGGSSRHTRAGRVDYASHSHYEVETLRPVASTQFRYDEQLARKLGAIPEDQAKRPSLVGDRITDLREVMRFDISPEWVMNRFARVSTVLAELQLEGLRVPVVTGIKADDMAGTLTYYFDQQGQLQRLSLHGFTGNPNRLIQTMTKHYGLQKEPTLEAGVYTRRWNGQPVHFLRITHAPVVYADAVHQKFTVFLELNQPNLGYGISDEARRIVSFDRASGRW